MKALFIKYREIISYLFWGVMTTVVSWVTYSLLISLFGTEAKLSVFGISVSLNVALANLFSWLCAVLFAFVTNKLFVFRSRSWKSEILWPELWKFISARIVTGVIEIIAVPTLVPIGLDQEIFGIAGSWAKVIVSVAVVILNYVFSKLFVFKKVKN